MMDKPTLIRHLRSAAEQELIENIAAGPGDSMSFRYHASLCEVDRRNKRVLSIIAIITAFISALASVFALLKP
jgi:hypothetical protein